MARSPSRSMRPRTRPGMEDIDNNVTRMTQGPSRPVPRPRDKAADFEADRAAGRAVRSGNREARLEAEALQERDEMRGYAEGGMVRGCKAGQMSGKGFSGTY